MNDVQLETLRESDFGPYLIQGKPAVVRLWKQHWFTGIPRSLTIADDVCRARIYPRIRYKHRRHSDPHDPGETLICRSEIILERVDDDEQAFILPKPRRIITTHGDVLIIGSEGLVTGSPAVIHPWVAILSSRPQDTAILKELLNGCLRR